MYLNMIPDISANRVVGPQDLIQFPKGKGRLGNSRLFDDRYHFVSFKKNFFNLRSILMI